MNTTELFKQGKQSWRITIYGHATDSRRTVTVTTPNIEDAMREAMKHPQYIESIIGVELLDERELALDTEQRADATAKRGAFTEASELYQRALMVYYRVGDGAGERRCAMMNRATEAAAAASESEA